jgi:hypothetical protein
MSKVKCIALAAALVVSGTTFALAQNGQPTGSQPPVAGGANADTSAPGMGETPTAPRSGLRRHGTIVHHRITKHHVYRPQ